MTFFNEGLSDIFGNVVGEWLVSPVTQKQTSLKMGGRKSKLHKKEIEQLVNKTNFTADEIKTWYSGFLRDCPTGKLYRSEFTKIYVQFFPRGDPTHFAKYVATLAPIDQNSEHFNSALSSMSLTTMATGTLSLANSSKPCPLLQGESWRTN